MTPDRAEVSCLFGLERDHRKLEPLSCFRGILEQGFHHLRQPRFDSLRAGDYQRAGAAGELGVEQQERQAGEMIAMKMRDQNQVDVVADDTSRFRAGSEEAPQSIRKLQPLPVT